MPVRVRSSMRSCGQEDAQPSGMVPPMLTSSASDKYRSTGNESALVHSAGSLPEMRGLLLRSMLCRYCSRLQSAVRDPAQCMLKMRAAFNASCSLARMLCIFLDALEQFSDASSASACSCFKGMMELAVNAHGALMTISAEGVRPLIFQEIRVTCQPDAGFDKN